MPPTATRRTSGRAPDRRRPSRTSPGSGALFQIFRDHRAVGERAALLLLYRGHAPERAPPREIAALLERVRLDEFVRHALLLTMQRTPRMKGEGRTPPDPEHETSFTSRRAAARALSAQVSAGRTCQNSPIRVVSKRGDRLFSLIGAQLCHAAITAKLPDAVSFWCSRFLRRTIS